MRPFQSLIALTFLAATITLPAQIPKENPQAEAIFAVLNKSVADWNRGDLDAFAASYKNSPDILFIGHKISHGYAQMLVNYKSAYATPEKMGTLAFTQLETQALDSHFATATGRFHLERSTAGGGNADGYFMLVLEKTPAGWKIVRDDTTADTPTTPH